MTVTIPTGAKTTDLVAKQAEITGLAAVVSTSPAYNQAQQLLNQRQQELVLSLIDRNALSAATILSSVSYKGTLPVLTAITSLNNNITTWTTTNPALATASAVTLEALRRQAVAELMASGQMSAATVLSQLSYAGAT
jgi:hypothetical protein